MRHSLLALSIAALLAGCNPAQDTKTTTSAAVEPVTAAETKAALSESERLNQWFETKYEEQLQMSPLQMTFLGRKDKQDQIDDVTEEAEDKQLAWGAATVEELKSQFDYNKLDTEAKTSYDLWIYQYEQSRDAAAFRVNTYVFNQMQGVHALLPQVLMNFHKVDEVVDMEAYVKRIGGIAKAIAGLIPIPCSRRNRSISALRYGRHERWRAFDNTQEVNDESDVPKRVCGWCTAAVRL